MKVNLPARWSLICGTILRALDVPLACIISVQDVTGYTL